MPAKKRIEPIDNPITDALEEIDHTEEPNGQILAATPGDIAGGKLTLNAQIETPNGKVDAWGMYEFRTRCQPGEAEEEVATRVIGIVTTRAMQLIEEAAFRVESFADNR